MHTVSAYRTLLLLLLSVMSVASVAQAQPVRSLLETRREGVVVQQWDTSCGAAALATVFTYGFKDPVSERSVAQGMLRRTDALRVKVRGGFSLLDMKRFAEARGYAAAGFRNVSFEELLGMHSPIVPIDEYGDAHFVVVRGLREGKVDIADPGFGNRTMSIERFGAAWKEGIAFVVKREKR
jgi:predicted double-glycine peptidase